MACEAARLEALGVDEVDLVWRGMQRLTIPLCLEAWPLEDIRGARYLRACKALLGRQQLTPAALVRDDWRELSDDMAAAAGVDRLPEAPEAPDQWFGGVPTLLRLLDDNEADLASDLKRFWSVDYARRWSTEDPLTLREIWTYVRRSQPTSAIAVADNGGRHVWTEPDFIGASIYQALTGQIYPGRPLKPDELDRALEAMRAKAAHVDKLRARQAHYAQESTPATSALEAAMANRRRELGAPDA